MPRLSASDFMALKATVMRKLLEHHEKEYHCHVQFVRDIGVELARTHHADEQLIEIACLLHDIGRDQELPGEEHPETGARIVRELLTDTALTADEVELIAQCVKHHGEQSPDASIEEKIVLTADAASKVLYHEAFMLMCKKQTYEEKLAWGNKYLEKGYTKCAFEDYKQRIYPRYKQLRAIYDAVAARV
jgi:putative nucleotidyltransferase with HDIG domain